jgi:RNA polymerase sigma factor (TIGR02999 family)
LDVSRTSSGSGTKPGPEPMTQPTGRERAAKAAEVFDELRKSGKSSEEIFVTLYSDLKQLARMKVARRPAGGSMHATRLLSDLYLRLFGKQSADFEWETARHFFNSMALAMERLLIDHARQFSRRGGKNRSLDEIIDEGFQPTGDPPSAPKGKNLFQENVERALVVKEALDRLEQDTPEGEKARAMERQAEIVRLRVFLGLTEDETAEVLECSSETVTKEFRKAKAKLARHLHPDAVGAPKPL